MYHWHHMLNLLDDNEFYREFRVYFVKELKIHLLLERFQLFVD
jgi:hypothetical protein